MKKFRNTVCLLLALCMCAALAGCSSSKSPAPAATSAAQTPAAQTEAPAMVYASEFKDLIRDSKNYIAVRSYGDDGLYYSSWEKVGENIPEGAKLQYEGQYDVYETFLYYLGKDGKAVRLENYKSLDAPVDEDGRREYSSGSDLSGICFTPDGFVTIESTYASWNTGDGNVPMYSEEYFQNQKYVQNYFIRTFDRTGRELSCAPIEVPQDTWLEAYRMQLDDKGNAVVSTGSGLRAIAPDGQDAYRIETQGYIENVLRLSDGRIAVFVGDAQTMLSILDSENGKLTDTTPVSFDAYSAISGSGDYDLYYTNGAWFYGYKLGAAEPVKLFNWISCDVNGERVNVVDVTDGVVTGVLSSYDMKTQLNSFELVHVREVPETSAARREPLTLAVNYLDFNLQDRIIEFNRRSTTHRIEVLDYSEYSNEKDGWDAGQTRLKTEILSGRMPDILCLNGLNYRHLASKGLLEDLYPWIDSDPELKREDFFPNVLRALEVDGKLCSTVSSYYISSAIGASSVVGQDPGWTYAEFNAALASMPEGCTAFDQYVTRDNILSTCLALDMEDFVDWGSGKVSFDSPQFIELLKFAASFPSDFDWENYDWASEMSTEERLAQGRQMLVQTSAFSIEDLFYNNYTQFLGGRITYVGYPTAHGTGNMFNFSGDAGYAVSSKSPNKEAAWQFLRTFFTEDYQSSSVYNLPSRIDVFETKAKEAATVEYQKNDEGKFVLDEDGEKIPIMRSSMWNSETGRVEEIYALTEDQIEQIRELIRTTTKVADYDQEILGIVTEQATPFFAGQKTVEEVARLVQSKANIYVNEQR